jgi:hypothetical protein
MAPEALSAGLRLASAIPQYAGRRAAEMEGLQK